jgi:hypothetical protein
MCLISYYDYLVKMLEWHKRENEEEHYFIENELGTFMDLKQCGLLKFFRIQGMRAQLRLLEYLVHMWDVNEHAFHMGSTKSLKISRISIS